MSDSTEGAATPTVAAGKLYDAQGQVIHGSGHQPGPRRGMGQLTDYVREQPISAALLAFGLGYIVGKII
ncbi:MAG: hypothetical protein ACREF1_16695 [Acetobacteraceae bacterium]